MAGRHAHDVGGERRVEAAGSTTVPPCWLRAPTSPATRPARRQLARQPAAGAPRVGRELQRGGAAHDRIGRVDRHVGDALEAPRRRRRSASGVRPAADAQRAAAGARRSSRRRRAPRRAPLPRSRTRSPSGRAGCRARASTFQAGRASPSGLTTPWKLCTRPSALTKVPEVSVNGAIGSSTSAMSCPALRNDVSATTISARVSAAAAAAALAASSAGSTLSSRHAFSGASPSAPSIWPAFSPPPPSARRRAGRRPSCRPRTDSRRSRRSARRSSARAAAARSPADAARRRCRAAPPCARR